MSARLNVSTAELAEIASFAGASIRTSAAQSPTSGPTEEDHIDQIRVEDLADGDIISYSAGNLEVDLGALFSVG